MKNNEKNEEKNEEKFSVSNTPSLGINRAMAQSQSNLLKQFNNIDSNKISGLNMLSVGIKGVAAQSQSNLLKQFNSIDFNKISGLNTLSVGIKGAAVQSQSNLFKQFNNIDFKKISGLNTPLVGINSAMAQLQSNLFKQFNNIDFKKISGLNTPLVGITSAMTQLQSNFNKQFNGIDFNKISSLNTPSVGITGAMAQLQSNLFKQFNNIDFKKISGLNTPLVGINSAMTQLQSNFNEQFNGIDFNKISSLNNPLIDIFKSIDQMKDLGLNDIRFNENGTIEYRGETIKIKDTVEDVIKDKLTKREEELNIEHEEKLKSLINLILYIFLIVFSISAEPKLYNLTQSKTFVEQKIIEGLNGLNENFEYGLDEMVKLFLYLITLSSQLLGTLNYMGTNSPFQFTIMLEIMKYILKRIYVFAEKQKEGIMISDEIVSDRKRFIKLIKNQVSISLKNEYDNEIINNIFYNNLALVKYKSLDVRSSNSIKSPIIYKLSLGEIVTIIEKYKEWTNIQFIGKDNNNYEGWVLNKYITKFN